MKSIKFHVRARTDGENGDWNAWSEGDVEYNYPLKVITRPYEGKENANTKESRRADRMLRAFWSTMACRGVISTTGEMIPVDELDYVEDLEMGVVIKRDGHFVMEEN